MSKSRVQHTLSIVAAIVGAVGGTIALCQPIEQFWGVAGWTISLLSLVQILATRRPAAEAEPPSIVWRVLFASIFTFCLLILTAMFVAAAAAGK